jgi:DNA adenine methylase
MITRMAGTNTAVIAQDGTSGTIPSAAKRFRSPLRYPGGKQRAIEQIARLFPESAREYREPLVGGGSVFFHARSSNFAEKYWINDKFSELFAFWRAVQDEETCARLMRDLEMLRLSFGNDPEKIKKYFLQARAEKTADRYRAALLFFFFNRVTFSGTTRAGGFSSAASLRRFTASSIERLAPLPQALADVQITNLDFEDVILKPGRGVFIFLDPPYFKASRLYGRGGILHDFDHVRLARILKALPKHRFLITYDDCPEIRKLYRWANIQDWQLQYGMNNCNLKKESKIGSELFISNY